MLDKDWKGRYLEEESSRWKERVETHLACLRSSSRIVWPELGEETRPLNGIIYTKLVWQSLAHNQGSRAVKTPLCLRPAVTWLPRRVSVGTSEGNPGALLIF